MLRYQQIELLHEKVKKQWSQIQISYRKSIESHEWENSILVDIKNYLENLRTILDFTSKEILAKYSSKSIRNYFPILSPTLTDEQIINTISGCFPDLKQNSPELFEYLKSIQPKYNISSKRLLEFNQLCNDNKHDSLTIQTRKDTIINKLQFLDGRTFYWTDGFVEFNSQNNEIILKPGGQFSGSNSIPISEDIDPLLRFGWIVKELFDHKISSHPNLKDIDPSTYSIKSYIIGNFYFPGHAGNAYTDMMIYMQKVTEIAKRAFELMQINLLLTY